LILAYASITSEATETRQYKSRLDSAGSFKHLFTSIIGIIVMDHAIEDHPGRSQPIEKDRKDNTAISPLSAEGGNQTKRRISFGGDPGPEKPSKRALVDDSSTEEEVDDDEHEVDDGRMRMGQAPAVDRHIFSSGHRLVPEEEAELMEDWMQKIAEQWGYVEKKNPNGKLKEWDRFHLRFQVGNTSICKLDRRPSIMKRNFFHDTISGQLLLLRLFILFGLPGQGFDDIDGYKCTWSLSLYHQDSGSLLKFYDTKGAPGVRFYGTEVASEHALEALGCLTSFNMLHPYDRVKAGGMA
jgi:hypothetical protein